MTAPAPPFHTPVRIPRLVWIVLVVSALSGVVAATLTFAEARRSSSADKADVRNIRSAQDCLIALLLVADEVRVTLSDVQVRDVCPSTGADRASDLRETTRPAPGSSAPPASSPPTTVAAVRRVPSRTTTSTVRRAPATTARPSPSTTAPPPSPPPTNPPTSAPPTTSTTTERPSPPCPTVPVLGACRP